MHEYYLLLHQFLSMDRHPCNAREGRNACNDLYPLGVLLPATSLQLSSKIFTEARQQISGSYIPIGRSHPVGIIIFSRCHFITPYKAVQPSPLHQNIINTSPCQRMLCCCVILHRCCYGCLYTVVCTLISYYSCYYTMEEPA